MSSVSQKAAMPSASHGRRAGSGVDEDDVRELVDERLLDVAAGRAGDDDERRRRRLVALVRQVVAARVPTPSASTASPAAQPEHVDARRQRTIGAHARAMPASTVSMRGRSRAASAGSTSVRTRKWSLRSSVQRPSARSGVAQPMAASTHVVSAKSRCISGS